MVCIQFRSVLLLALFLNLLLAVSGVERDETGALQDMGSILQDSKIQVAPDMKKIGMPHLCVPLHSSLPCVAPLPCIDQMKRQMS